MGVTPPFFLTNSSATPPMAQPHVLLALPSRMSSVNEVEGFVNDVIAAYRLSDDLRGNLLISLTEAVTNAIRHGNRCDADKKVTVEVWRRKRDLRVVVTDEGEGFEPKALPDPTSPEFLEREGGRGVFLMRALSDAIEYRADGRCVEMCYECGSVLAATRGKRKAVAGAGRLVAAA